MNVNIFGKECSGRYYVDGHYEEFEKGTFLGFGIDYAKFQNGLAQYTTAIVELRDGKVIVTTPENIRFIHEKHIPRDPVKVDPVETPDVSNDEISSGNEEDPEEKKNETAKRKSRIDYGKIMALHNAGWSNGEIADEMRMKKSSVATAICIYKKNHLGGG